MGPQNKGKEKEALIEEEKFLQGVRICRECSSILKYVFQDIVSLNCRPELIISKASTAQAGSIPRANICQTLRGVHKP